MRKATNFLLGAVLAAALASGAQAAGKAGIGLEWSWVPVVPLGGFDMEMSGQEFTLAWDVSDNFSVGVFRGDGQYRGTHEYTDNSAPTIDRKLTVRATTAISGLRLLTVLPVMNDMLSVGLEMGAMTFGTATYDYVASDGSACVAGDFGVPDSTNIDGYVAPLLGLVGKIKLIEAKSSTVTTALTVSGGLRFVPLLDEDLLGTQQTVMTAPLEGIDPITNYTNIAVQVGLGLWF